jgi:predicted dehydrogenase
VRGGELGRIHAVELCFHNAYGPDKAWFRDPRLSGGGCVMDLGTHLVDLALWMLDFPGVVEVRSTLLAGGRRVHGRDAGVVEDYAAVELVLDGGTSVRLACSWNLPAGRDCVIEASFYGERGGASVRNRNGSFYDLVAERYRGTARETLAEPPDAWGGRAAAVFAQQLAQTPRYDPSAEHLLEVHRVLDRIYAA